MKEGYTRSNISEEMGVARMICKVYLFELLSEGKVKKYVVSQSISFGRDIETWRITN
jgi:predicted ArsR family transcriptional regulator